MSEGWIKLHRRLIDWEWFDDHNTFRLFMYILLKANYEPKKWHGIEIARGQLLTSSVKLAEATSISRQSVRTSLERLKSTNELTIKSTKQYSILTVVKYSEYQVRDDAPTNQSTNRLTNSQPTANQQLTTTKERKNIKEGKKEEYIGDFDSFWNTYGKIGNKQQAIKFYNKAIKEGVNHEEIIRGVTEYQTYCRAIGQEQRYIKHASTWLNNKGWEDDYTVHNTETKQERRSRESKEAAARGMLRAENPDF